jgi:hypothetical protein
LLLNAAVAVTSRVSVSQNMSCARLRVNENIAIVISFLFSAPPRRENMPNIGRNLRVGEPLSRTIIIQERSK